MISVTTIGVRQQSSKTNDMVRGSGSTTPSRRQGVNGGVQSAGRRDKMRLVFGFVGMLVGMLLSAVILLIVASLMG